ncbi:lipopolysaccharide/colanic/teichoic acid biosynthesis glycosyltransferase [Litoreibacter meonggei]|uniref:Lipopolysaccharide/colanic/teichoic acid biosynthesis glycosyltransferase n=1 Tax=Litoreibacter meonggei TaxID=1049199 RepID=A0A497VQZ8_9RHOB|nr:sugar transferase [Litoreibacter meonggei]RLJ41436.1 lipopolysaccharide/colanic/teichoic acid biosynthesis glycosyltransferase [Litoreibacter meonggei]
MDARPTTEFETARSVVDTHHVPVVKSQSSGASYALFWKRTLDIILVIVTAPISVPLVFLGACLAMLDGGSAFYFQPRVGRGGKMFRMFKLRTMRVDAERRLSEILMQDPRAAIEWQQNQKLRRDPRVTYIGKALRKTSLDELPQLWNVVLGDMSLVGPRPILQEQAILYPGSAYFKLRPGLTGPWQVLGRNDESFVSRAKYDAMYERELGLFSDLSLIGRTFGVVLLGTGH